MAGSATTDIVTGTSGAPGEDATSFMRDGQLAIDRQFPPSAGGKSPCFAVAFGKPACNFQPCLDPNGPKSREHSRITDAHRAFAAQYARSKGFAPNYSEFMAARRN